MTTIEQAKKAAGQKAAQLVLDGMIVGLGTGTTAYWFIHSLIPLCKKINIQAVATSSASLEQARKGGIPLLDVNTITSIDITVDGADEIDPERRMIKGGGGALLKEKIIASMSKEVIVIIDETKLVPKLGKCKLPVEIVPFGVQSTIHKLEQQGFSGTLRKDKNGIYKTENGNYIYDIHLDPNKTHPAEDHERLIQIPGVIETGFFLNLATQVIVGFLDGTVRLT
ncbi:MAG: ribose-5-phosphate isomerase RpiA [Rhabdochlamydiaceae bacterium]|jgi:ribose 5-phosphate isomerase A